MGNKGKHSMTKMCRMNQLFDAAVDVVLHPPQAGPTCLGCGGKDAVFCRLFTDT
jgi:hypothetical protein